MFDPEQKIMLYERAKSFYDTMTRCEKGADIHQIENIRHTLSMLMDCIEGGDIEQDRCEGMLKRLESQISELFIKRYGPK